jgi:hypothetical protein
MSHAKSFFPPIFIVVFKLLRVEVPRFRFDDVRGSSSTSFEIFLFRTILEIFVFFADLIGIARDPENAPPARFERDARLSLANSYEFAERLWDYTSVKRAQVGTTEPPVRPGSFPIGAPSSTNPVHGSEWRVLETPSERHNPLNIHHRGVCLRFR